MEHEKLLEKPLFQLTTKEFLFIQKNNIDSSQPVSDSNYTTKNYVYGIKGIAKIFDCSISTAKRFKSSEWIQPAITQRGRKIITDVDLALKLAKTKTGGRK